MARHALGQPRVDVGARRRERGHARGVPVDGGVEHRPRPAVRPRGDKLVRRRAALEQRAHALEATQLRGESERGEAPVVLAVGPLAGGEPRAHARRVVRLHQVEEVARLVACHVAPQVEAKLGAGAATLALNADAALELAPGRVGGRGPPLWRRAAAARALAVVPLAGRGVPRRRARSRSCHWPGSNSARRHAGIEATAGGGTGGQRHAAAGAAGGAAEGAASAARRAFPARVVISPLVATCARRF
jgi:hypothetical protein